MHILWKQGAPVPVSCNGHTAVWLNGLVYVGGGTMNRSVVKHMDGCTVNAKPLRIINCYDPVNDSWRSPINTPQCYFAMTTLNNNLVIAGGQINRIKTNQILTVDINAGQLKNYAKMITARSAAVAASHQGMLIITGGYDENKKMLSSTEIYDTTNGQWYMCSDLPQPHILQQPLIVDNILFLLGGIRNKEGNSSAVFAASLNNLSVSRHQLEWNTYQDSPWHRCYPVSINGTHLLTVGGVKKNGQTCTSEIYKFNKITHSWKAIGHIPSPRYLTAAVSTADNRVIVIGGRDDKGKHTNTVWIGSFVPQ